MSFERFLFLCCGWLAGVRLHDINLLFYQVWQLGSSTPNFTLEGHEKGVNCVDYYNGGDKPYLVSGADDKLVKIWDYQVSHVAYRYNRVPIMVI